jgi:nucleoside-diphosphate-sugar epimerase
VGHDVNIATQSEISVGDLTRKLVNQIGSDIKVEEDQQRLRPEKSEVFRLFGSNQKLMEYTDWKPKYTLDAGLKETIEWFSQPQNIAGYKSDIYNL